LNSYLALTADARVLFEKLKYKVQSTKLKVPTSKC
jgi:hypothetical protein